MLKKSPEQCQHKPFGLIPLPSSQLNTSYELTLPRLPAQPPWPVGADGAQTPRRGTCRGTRGLPRELLPGTAAWQEAVVRKVWGIYHHRIITKTKTTLPQHHLWRLKGPCSTLAPAGPPTKGDHSCWAGAHPQQSCCRGLGEKKKKTEPEERFLHGNGWSCWQISTHWDNVGLGFPSLLPPGSSQPLSSGQLQVDAAVLAPASQLPCPVPAGGHQLTDLQEHPSRLQCWGCPTTSHEATYTARSRAGEGPVRAAHSYQPKDPAHS